MGFLTKQFYKCTVKIYFYVITNMTNGKKYIGQSIHPKRRFREHKCRARTGSVKSKLYNSMRKNGLDKFKFDILDIVIYGHYYADLKERELVSINNSFKNGYNQTIGGDGTNSGKSHHMYQKAPWNKGKKCPQLSGSNNANFERPRSEEQKLKQSIAMSGENHPNYGKSLNEKTKINISKSKEKTWKIFFDNGTDQIVTNLKEWCGVNGYNNSHICSIYKGNRLKHKNIIKVLLLS